MVRSLPYVLYLPVKKLAYYLSGGSAASDSLGETHFLSPISPPFFSSLAFRNLEMLASLQSLKRQ